MIEASFDKERDKMIVVFDGDIFEEKVLDFDELIAEGEKSNMKMILNQMQNKLSRIKKMDIRHSSVQRAAYL